MQNTTEKVKAVSIWLHRAEGRHDECVSLTVEGGDVWSKANGVLMKWSHTAPKELGYNKCDFKVTYADGQTYEGRYDLVHSSREYPSLERHVSDFLTFLAGTRCPPHMKEADYRRVLSYQQYQESMEPAKQFLATYQIGA